MALALVVAVAVAAAAAEVGLTSPLVACSCVCCRAMLSNVERSVVYLHAVHAHDEASCGRWLECGGGDGGMAAVSGACRVPHVCVCVCVCVRACACVGLCVDPTYSCVMSGISPSSAFGEAATSGRHAAQNKQTRKKQSAIHREEGVRRSIHYKPPRRRRSATKGAAASEIADSCCCCCCRTAACALVARERTDQAPDGRQQIGNLSRSEACRGGGWVVPAGECTV